MNRLYSIRLPSFDVTYFECDKYTIMILLFDFPCFVDPPCMFLYLIKLIPLSFYIFKRKVFQTGILHSNSKVTNRSLFLYLEVFCILNAIRRERLCKYNKGCTPLWHLTSYWCAGTLQCKVRNSNPILTREEMIFPLPSKEKGKITLPAEEREQNRKRVLLKERISIKINAVVSMFIMLDIKLVF